MMKRILTVLAALMLLVPSACAEIVGRAGEEYIHRWDAPNGQALYFVSRETEPYVVMKDVNFDGVEDVVVTTFVGASNFGAEFFVWDDGDYVPVEHFEADEIVNYSLHPELGLVETYIQQGRAGALYTRQLWRWWGNELSLMREAIGSEEETWYYEDDLVTVVTDRSHVYLRVRDHYHLTAVDGDWNPTLIMEEVVDLYDEEALSDALDEADRIFWQDVW